MSDTSWTDVLAADDLRTDDVVGVVAAGQDLAIYSVGGAIYATGNICTHGQARLCEGFLLDHEIECPLHQGRFDVRDGRPMCEPVTEPIATYPVKIEGGRVYVQLSGS